ncbi:MAG: hypothetical protein WDO73_12760 [Ignavibacteriota bacterium]
MVFGGLLPPADLSSLPEKQLYGVHKPTVDVCFAGWRYMPEGRDKGYGTFIKVAELLARRSTTSASTSSDPGIRVTAMLRRWETSYSFTPRCPTVFKAFFRRMDLIVSPMFLLC